MSLLHFAQLPFDTVFSQQGLSRGLMTYHLLPADRCAHFFNTIIEDTDIDILHMCITLFKILQTEVNLHFR